MDKDFIRTRVTINEQTGCWDWNLRRDKDGYGSVSLYNGGNRTYKRSHRVVYELWFPDTFDANLLVLHNCDRPCCCAPSHLFQGTHTDNRRDAFKKGRAKQPSFYKQVKGTECYSSKLTDAQVPQMRAMREQGCTYKVIADRFGVHISTAFSVCKGDSWKHVN